MKLNISRKVFLLAATAFAFAAFTGISAAAQAETRASNLKSKGIFDYENGTVVIDSSDLNYLADEIDLLEDTYKSKTTDSLNEIGMFFRADGTASHNEDESLINSANKNTSLLTFAQINDAIRQSQSVENAPAAAEIINGKSAYANGIKINGTMPDNGAIEKSNLAAGDSYTIPAGYTTGGTVTAASLESQTPATAVAENLSKGVTAWINGVKITGTGGDNNSYYNQGYAAGISDVITNGRVSYTYHTHTGSPASGSGCYTEPIFHNHDDSGCSYTMEPCQLYINFSVISQRQDYTDTEGQPVYWYVVECNRCGHLEYSGKSPGHYYYNYTCGHTEDTVESYSIGCGKVEGVTIESASIVFP